MVNVFKAREKWVTVIWAKKKDQEENLAKF